MRGMAFTGVCILLENHYEKLLLLSSSSWSEPQGDVQPDLSVMEMGENHPVCKVFQGKQRSGNKYHVLQTMVEVVNMLPPPYMLPQKAPKPAAPLCCAITGKPAKYRDPVGGYGYVDLEAYKELKQRMQNERRGHTGKRTKRQSSKGLNTLTPMHQQDAESDPAQLATAAAQDHTAVPPQSLDAADLLPKQAQSAADAKDADLPGTAAAEEAACTVVTPLPAVSPQAAPAVAPATADVAQAQAVSTGVQIHVAPGAAGTTAGMAETLGPAPMAQQDSQQAHGLTPATDRLSAAAVGPDHVVTDASDTLDAGMPLLPAVSKPVVSPSGQHCVTSKVLRYLNALLAALLLWCRCLAVAYLDLWL